MIEILPAILVKTEDEFRERLATIESLVSWAQLDVVDGKFAPNVTWGDPNVIAAMETPVRFEIDLMVEDVERAVHEWLRALPNVGRIFFHVEAIAARAHYQRHAAGEAEARHLIARIKKAGCEAGMSLNPRTPVSSLEPFAEHLDAVLLLGVEPGFGGQHLQPSIFEKVAAFREKHPRLPLTVDGGVNAATAPRLVAAGATRLAAGSYIFNHPQGPAEAIEELRSAAAIDSNA